MTLRHLNSNKSERRLVNTNSNDPTEDTSNQIVQSKQPITSLSNGMSSKSSLEGLKAVTVKLDGRNMHKVKTLWNIHENKADIEQLINEKDSIINKMTKEKHQLQTELNTLRRNETKSLLHKIEHSTALIPFTTRRTELIPNQRNAFKLEAAYTTRKVDKIQARRPSINDINTKLTSGLNLVKNLEECIMGIQCDIRLLEERKNSKPRAKGKFSSELRNLKDKIRQFVTIADNQRISYQINV